MRPLCFFVVLPILVVQCFAADFNQERATVRVCNLKYVEECYSITRRLKRGQPYKTNMTAVSRDEWGNNVTLRVIVHNGFPIEVLNLKLCDVTNVKWLEDYLRAYSNISKCPIRPGRIGIYNMDLPPKNLPQIILNQIKGKTYVRFLILVTATEEMMVENTITIG